MRPAGLARKRPQGILYYLMRQTPATQTLSRRNVRGAMARIRNGRQSGRIWEFGKSVLTAPRNSSASRRAPGPA